MNFVELEDPAIWSSIAAEQTRQAEGLEMIASENFTSPAVMQAVGSVLTNKYAEGYPGRRYYGGCEVVDEAEELARSRAQELFGAEHANVQSHSGTQANIAAYGALLSPGDRVLAMDLAHGGHLSHGARVSLTGKIYQFEHYPVNADSEMIDLDLVEQLAREFQPKLIVAGASAYPRIIDFAGFRHIADEVGAKLMVDMAHIAGLVATGIHPSPVPHADVVTTTTHKTLRGPRGGLVLCKEEHQKALDRMVLPGIQGGPLVHIIAAKAVCLKEAMSETFMEYQTQIVSNAKALALAIQEQGFRIVSDGTDNHLCLVEVFSQGITGKQAETALEQALITVNKNMIPFDTHPPLVTSGIRLGTPAVTTRNMKEPEMGEIAEMMGKVLKNIDSDRVQSEVKEEVKTFTDRFPLYAKRLVPVS